MSKLFNRNPQALLRKTGILLLLVFLLQRVSAQQQILLYTESFDNGTTAFVFDSAGLGANHGNNDWIINSQFTGAPTYPNTPNEDSVLAGLGQIHNAPFSSYLHIHDVAAPSVADANWNPANGSDRFCYVGSPFCTLGLSDVIFSFFWIGEGDSTAYGRVYYRANGGPWIQTGQAKYNGESLWKYEAISNPAFNNVQNLEFGFRWVNSSGDTTKDVSWGIDDIIAVGTYDNINNPVNIHVTSVTPDTVCQKDNILIGWALDAPLCDGTYQINLSDSIGSFANPINEGVFDIYSPQVAGYIYIQAPNNVSGNCFKVTITRITPAPVITSDTSVCFAIHHCPVNIVTDNAPVMHDNDTTCIKSAIDISFNSFGNFNNNNVYYAQLSDSNGSFAHADTIGHLTSNASFPGMPGSVSGLIPNVPPGCGYYIRIVSSNPASEGTVIGPYCLTQCDVTTNHTQDIHVCINYPNATDTVKLAINPHQWPDGSSYDTCNSWTVELLDMMSFSVVNIGGLGIYHDSIGGTFNLIVGPLNTLPVAPGSYYMRILSNCSNEPWNETGTVIRITIGAPSSSPPSIINATADSVFCNSGGLLDLFVVPYNPNSKYFWNSSIFNFGQPIEEPGDQFLGNMAGAPIGDYVFYVREQSFGCFGPSSAPYTYYVTGLSPIRISGPKKVCQGDTAVFNASYLPQTFYQWFAPPGVRVVVTSNTQVSMVFDSLGSYTIRSQSINYCGTDTGSATIQVYSLFKVNAKPDKLVCYGDTVTLTGAVAPYPKEFSPLDSIVAGNQQGGMFNIITHNDIILDSFAVVFRSRVANTVAAIYTKNGTYKGFQQTSSAWSPVATVTIPQPSPALTKTVIPHELNKTILAGDTTAFYITTTNTPAVYEAYGTGTGIQQGVIYKSDGVIDFVQGTANAYPFGASIGPKILDVTIYYRTKAGLHYTWSNGDTGATISFVPTQSSEYYIRVFDTTGCNNNDSVHVKVDTLPHVNAGPDTLVCPAGNYVMLSSASPTAMVSWLPASGLSQADALNPTFNYNQSTNYILTATNPDGCKKSDSVQVNVFPLSVNAGPDTLVCSGQDYVMQGLASTDSIEWIPSVGLSAINILNPVFNYTETTQYYLQVKDTNNCTLVDSVIITVDYCNAYVKAPDAFTPNGDGTNDHFTVYGKYISDYLIRIYNRWGELVYQSSDINELNDLGRGWDGTFKGKLQDVGTFVYYIEAKDFDGKKIFKKGNITLIR